VHDELEVVARPHVENGTPDPLHAGLSWVRIQPAATITTGFRATAGGPPPPDVTNAASISGQSIPGIGAPASDHDVVPGGAEEWRVGLVELLATGELPPRRYYAPAARGGHDRHGGASRGRRAWRISVEQTLHGRTAWTMTLEMLERPLPARREKQRWALGFGGSQSRQHHVA
jgi:hypothetical protein